MAICGANDTSHKLIFTRVLLLVLLNCFLCNFDSLNVNVLDGLLRVEFVGSLTEACCVECICFNDIRSGFQVVTVNLFNHIGTRNNKNIVVSLQVSLMTCILFTSEVLLLQLVGLYASTYRSVNDRNS